MAAGTSPGLRSGPVLPPGRQRARPFPAPRTFHCCPDRQDAEAPLVTAVRPPVRALFPSACGQCLRSTPWPWRAPRRRGPPVPALVGAASRWRRAVADGRGSRPRGGPETSGRAVVSRPVSTALRRQGRVVAWAEGPRHHRPRLRHEAHRRGAASAASRPPQARAPTVVVVRLSAQPPADRSVQRLIPRCRWTAPAHGWAARPCLAPRRLDNALEQPLRLASPHRPPKGSHGRRRRRCALSVPRIPATPHHPLGGSADRVPLLEVSGCAAPATGPLRAFLLPCKRLECTAAGLLRQDPASRCAPARPAPTDEPPAQAGGRARQASVLADRGHRPWAYRGTGGARACRTRRGCGQAPRVVARRPHTPASRNGLLVNWSFTSRAVCRESGAAWKASHGRGGLAGGRRSEAAPLACLWPLRFAVLGRPRTVISTRSCVKARPRSARCCAASTPARSDWSCIAPLRIIP